MLPVQSATSTLTIEKLRVVFAAGARVLDAKATGFSEPSSIMSRINGLVGS